MTLVENAGMPLPKLQPGVPLRTQVVKPASGSVFGASFGAAPPWPTVPWHVKQPTRRNTLLPFSTVARSMRGGSAAASDARQSRADAASSCFMRESSTRLRHDVDQVRLAALHDADAAAEGGGEVLGVRDRPRCADA